MPPRRRLLNPALAAQPPAAPSGGRVSIQPNLKVYHLCIQYNMGLDPITNVAQPRPTALTVPPSIMEGNVFVRLASLYMHSITPAEDLVLHLNWGTNTKVLDLVTGSPSTELAIITADSGSESGFVNHTVWPAVHRHIPQGPTQLELEWYAWLTNEPLTTTPPWHVVLEVQCLD